MCVLLHVLTNNRKQTYYNPTKNIKFLRRYKHFLLCWTLHIFTSHVSKRGNIIGPVCVSLFVCLSMCALTAKKASANHVMWHRVMSLGDVIWRLWARILTREAQVALNFRLPGYCKPPRGDRHPMPLFTLQVFATCTYVTTLLCIGFKCASFYEITLNI